MNEIRPEAKRMIDALDKQDAKDQIHDVMPIVELDVGDLYNTQFGQVPVQSKIRALPYLNPEKTPVVGIRAYVLVNVYADGTAIAIHKAWKYAYSEKEPTLDGCPVKKQGKNECVVKFYLLGCKHEYEERNDLAIDYNITLLSMDHFVICKKCAHHYVVNSSD